MNDYITEAEAIGDYDNCIVAKEIDLRRNFQHFNEVREKSILSDYDHYLFNKAEKVGSKITCAENRCKKIFIKKSYQQAFCCDKHKNQFWNRQKLL